MSDTTLGSIETAAGMAKFIGEKIARFYGGEAGEAAASLLLGQPQWAASTADLLEKLQNGTATGEDIADVLDATASTLAGGGLLIGGIVPALAVSPLIFEITGLVGLGLTIYENGPAVWSAIRNQFRRGESWDTPIILDLDGDGVETTGVKEGAYFDHGGDGFAEQTGWVGSDDGLLVMDRDGNGRIDSGSELFGNNTLLADGTRAANGFEALEELDSNLDGKIDGQDAAFYNLRVWKDADGNGYTTEGELLTLAEAGVQAINTGYTSSTAVDADGNAHKLTGTYTTDDGQTRSATDVWFKTDAMYTIATEWLEVPADIAALPNLQGYGQVYDLHQAMVRDASGALKDLLSRFAIATTTEERETLIPQIIYKWAGVDGIDPESRGIYIGDARMLASLEAFLGESFYQYSAVGNPNWDFSNPFWKASDEIRTAFSMFAEQVYGQLVAQTSQKPLFDQITYTWDEASQSIRGGFGVRLDFRIFVR